MIVVPVDYWPKKGVNVYIGPWIGHHTVHWANWRVPIDILERQCQQPVFQVLHPSKVRAQLKSRLSLIEGGARTQKTTRDGVERVKKFLALNLCVLCDAATISARQNLVRALHVEFPEQVRVVGNSRLSELEKTRTLEALVGQRMKEDFDAMPSLSRDFLTRTLEL